MFAGFSHYDPRNKLGDAKGVKDDIDSPKYRNPSPNECVGRVIVSLWQHKEVREGREDSNARRDCNQLQRRQSECVKCLKANTSNNDICSQSDSV